MGFEVGVKKSISFLFLVGIFVLQAGCASYFKRKECEATNWFEYGQKVALDGRRLTGDGFVNECRQVEAEIREADLDQGFKAGMARYCQPNEVFDIGKRGDPFSTEMCDGENPRALQERHKAGLLEYCKKTNGFSAGASGKLYKRLCPADLEAGFLPEYRRGRKKYLTVLTNENDKRVYEIDRELVDMERERNMKSLEYQRAAFLPGIPADKMSADQKRIADDLRWKVQSVENRISDKRAEQNKLREKNRELKLEIVQLDGDTNG